MCTARNLISNLENLKLLQTVTCSLQYISNSSFYSFSQNNSICLIYSWLFMHKASLPFGLFACCCSFWFFVPTKTHNEQCNTQMKTSTKNQYEQQKAITSNNKRHLPVLFFEIELILSQKQERAAKSSKRQRTANRNTHQKPERATKSNKEHFSFPFSFIRTNSEPMEGGWYQKQRKAMKSSKKLRRATKSNNGHRSWKTQNGQEKPRRTMKGTKSPNWNQA